MANTFCQVYVHIVFSVKYREHKITTKIKDRLIEYIGGIIKGEGQVPLCINSMPDHIHILVSMNTSISIADLVRKIKSNSSAFIKNNKLSENFSWQNGYGAFSVSKDKLDRVSLYIQNQEKHHETRSFKEEYIDFLKKLNIKFENKYVFDL